MAAQVKILTSGLDDDVALENQLQDFLTSNSLTLDTVKVLTYGSSEQQGLILIYEA